MIQHKEVYKNTADIQGNKKYVFGYAWADYLPIVTSEELWASKNLFRCCQTLGIQSMIFTSSAFLILPLISVSMSFLLRKRPRKPLTGSVWFAHSTHLGQNSRKGHYFSSMLLSATIPHYISYFRIIRIQRGYSSHTRAKVTLEYFTRWTDFLLCIVSAHFSLICFA